MVSMWLPFWFLVFVMSKDNGVRLEPSHCYSGGRAGVKEGALGSSRAFPWLGVLRVHLHQESTFKIALTGIVLVKEKYAIANADDIVRIPKRVFKEDSRAMFIPVDRSPWFCRPVDYVTHPEYKLDTTTSLALIELALPPDTTDFPMRPVCWPLLSYNMTADLYAVGYTDQNQLLEKYIYKLKHVDQELCREFYSRAGLSESEPASRFLCGLAANNKKDCTWEHGTALVSNSTARWILVGFGVRGPSCSAPARFLALESYFSWIEAASNLDEPEYKDYRKSAFGIGFKKSDTSVEYIPAHELLRTNVSGRKLYGKKHQKHDFGHYYGQDLEQEDPFTVDRVSDTEILVKLAKDKPYKLGSYGNCKEKGIYLVYKDFINIVVTQIPQLSIEENKGSVVKYRMSLHDSYFKNYTCITIKLYSTKGDEAYLNYETKMSDDTAFPENPEELIREYPFHTLTRIVDKETSNDHLAQSSIKSSGKTRNAFNVNLFLKATFHYNCKLEFRFYGPRVVGVVTPPPTTAKIFTLPSTTGTTGESTTESTTTRDPYDWLRKNKPLEQNDAVDFVVVNVSIRNIGALYLLCFVAFISCVF